jgi:hypothetical protein
MYAQCDKDGNEYILSDSFVDFRKDGNGNASSLANKKITAKGRPSLHRTIVG